MIVFLVALFALIKVIQTDGLEVLNKDFQKVIKIHEQTNMLLVSSENLKACHIKGPQLHSYKATRKNGEFVCEISLPLNTHVHFPSSLKLIAFGDKVEYADLENVPVHIKNEFSDIEEDPFCKLKDIHHVFGDVENSGSWYVAILTSVVIIALPWLYLLFQMSKVNFKVYTSGLVFLLFIVFHLAINFNFWYHGSLFPALFQHFFVGIVTILVGHRALVDRIKHHVDY
eukprot:NODE_5_length_49639_cov_0.484336.p17 type:complete len:228 gc:universal NODE_5_length_49639_cov_0.484336:3036-2353(-)